MSCLSTFIQVYQGSLPTGQLIAIKRAKKESMQGGLEFKTEIELLSRVHHKNLVSLMGFCFEKGEQILVYEYVSNGSLKDSLSGTSIHFSPTLLRITVFVDTSISHVIDNHMELFNSLAFVVITIKSIIVRPYTLHL